VIRETRFAVSIRNKYGIEWNKKETALLILMCPKIEPLKIKKERERDKKKRTYFDWPKINIYFGT
jgi:hypothetical protein